jgi:oligoribonuclease
MLLWLDLETTGLHPERHTILEVACILTDDDLNEKSRWESIVRPGVSDVRRLMALTSDDFVIDMHTKNGLLDEINAGLGVSMDVAEQAILKLVEGIPKKELYLAGNSVHFDMRFLQEHMPSLAKKLSYRMFDVRVLMMVEDMWLPAFTDKGDHDVVHRALDDIEWSLEMARQYRDHFSSK